MLIQPVQERKPVVHPTVGDAAFTVILYWLYVAVEIFYMCFLQVCNFAVCRLRNKQNKRGIFPVLNG